MLFLVILSNASIRCFKISLTSDTRNGLKILTPSKRDYYLSIIRKDDFCATSSTAAYSMHILDLTFSSDMTLSDYIKS